MARKDSVLTGFSLYPLPISPRRFEFPLACVASVSVGFGSKERPRNGIFGVLSARKMGREPKKKREGAPFFAL